MNTEIGGTAACETCSATKPIGGYRTITTRQVCSVWSAFRGGELAHFLDVRVYFALHEIAERRAAAGRVRRRQRRRGQVPDLNRKVLVHEIQRLVGVARMARIRASLCRLEGVGLVRITNAAIVFDESAEENAEIVGPRSSRMLVGIHDRPDVRERSVPVPRRTLRFLAQCGRPAMVATMLGHLIRCLWWSDGQCKSVGACSVAFVAGLFDVHDRNVKRARAELRRMEWLRGIPAAARYVNAYGSRAAINLAWSSSENQSGFATTALVMPKPPPPQPRIVPKSPPPIHKLNLPSGSKNHNPASSGPVGVRKRTENPEKPAFRFVVPEDLRSVVRLDALFAEAVSRGLVRESPVERLRFFAAAEHAQRVGRENPCGLFVAVVRRALWSFISQGDEDRALLALKGRESCRKSAVVDAAMNRSRAALPNGRRRVAKGRGDWFSELVRDVARLRSFDGVIRAARNRPPCDERTVAAA